MGFYHHKITPLWPLANGMVENFMRSINKLVKTAHMMMLMLERKMLIKKER